MVYRKAMQLSSAEVARMGIGGIANLQSNDVQKMSRFRLDINPLWDAPFQVQTMLLPCVSPAVARHMHPQATAFPAVAALERCFAAGAADCLAFDRTVVTCRKRPARHTVCPSHNSIQTIALMSAT